jgi:hypothetical protein
MVWRLRQARALRREQEMQRSSASCGVPLPAKTGVKLGSVKAVRNLPRGVEVLASGVSVLGLGKEVAMQKGVVSLSYNKSLKLTAPNGAASQHIAVCGSLRAARSGGSLAPR